ncbi:hypothetical protein TUMEXPCC7403_03835 [Tumidithrix helvetica PCC 7403]|uniref:hypothetical protein n=1 Tax=Tumidithrix helvetica TaxID=3457545 RepID=UPI003CAB4955
MSAYPTAPDLEPTDYIVLGLANCFVKEEGEVHQVKVAEPIPSAALEAILKQIPTSYELAYATELGKVLDDNGNAQIPSDVFVGNVQICDEFLNRAIAAARTYKVRPEAQKHILLGQTHTDLNLSLEKKRVLNSDRVVKEEDNVKQHSHTHKVL